MLGLCEIHKKPEIIFVSRKVKTIILNKEPFYNYHFCRLVVFEMDNGIKVREINYTFEKSDIEYLGLSFANEVFVYDRDKTLKERNDRFIYLKIVGRITGVCEDCLKTLRDYLIDNGFSVLLEKASRI